MKMSTGLLGTQFPILPTDFMLIKKKKMSTGASRGREARQKVAVNGNIQ